MPDELAEFVLSVQKKIDPKSNHYLDLYAVLLVICEDLVAFSPGLQLPAYGEPANRDSIVLNSLRTFAFSFVVRDRSFTALLGDATSHPFFFGMTIDLMIRHLPLTLKTLSGSRSFVHLFSCAMAWYQR
jgi:hypothetical protein